MKYQNRAHDRPQSSRDANHSTATTPRHRGPGRPRHRPVRAERELILATTLQAIASDGLDNISVASIAKRAGIGRASVYDQFGSRDRLIEAALAEVTETISSKLVPAFSPSDEQPWQDVVRRGFAALFELTTQERELMTVVFLAGSSSSQHSAMITEARHRLIEELTEVGRREWAAFGIEVGHAAYVVCHMIFSLGETIARHHLRDGADNEPLTDLLATFATGGLLAVADDGYRALREVDAMYDGAETVSRDR